MLVRSMSTVSTLPTCAAPASNAQAWYDRLNKQLRPSFEAEFHLFDGTTGEVVHRADDQPLGDWMLGGELCREVARRGRPEFLAAESPVAILAIPLSHARYEPVVAVAAFTTHEIDPSAAWSAEALALVGLSQEEARAWARRQTPYPHHALQRLSELFIVQSDQEQQVEQLTVEADQLTSQIAATYEEISLLYRLIQNLHLSNGSDAAARLALEWIEEVLPVECVVVQLLPAALPESVTHDPNERESLWLTHGDCPLDVDEFDNLVEYLQLSATSPPLVANLAVTGRDTWPLPAVRQLVVVPLAEGSHLFGWIAVVNHRDDKEFGTVEANLLSSVGTILGINSSNIDLYRQQAELLAGVVRALTSAIDAKDPYTCGHSDRVARVSVRLGQELGLDEEMLKTLYLGGLLHDVGKIGIEDEVLRKPGKLTTAEFEHIKTHAEIGYNILIDLKQLGQVLPIVRHHHESWDGGGYPLGLAAENIPFLARLVAVSDAFDAMGSDRPYRKGMDDEKLDRIIREGSGKQWDAEVVEAFFRARDDIRAIVNAEPGQTEESPQWS